ncbi:hypothetical protein C1H46_031596 [Malus baccata]|uniref:Uncharacterized protein n=1 Tax=Malus baccata TaxID=106549 RepID=A0A540L962_MALBA|nr:hypothetical protein C1H46_031596 [Malus baccata]
MSNPMTRKALSIYRQGGVGLSPPDHALIDQYEWELVLEVIPSNMLHVSAIQSVHCRAEDGVLPMLISQNEHLLRDGRCQFALAKHVLNITRMNHLIRLPFRKKVSSLILAPSQSTWNGFERSLFLEGHGAQLSRANVQPLRAVDFHMASLNHATKVTGNSLYNPPMSMPINNKEDLEAFMEAHHDMLGGCHLELERHNIDIRSKLALIIGSDPAKYLHSYVSHSLVRWNRSWIRNLSTKDKDYDCDTLRVIRQWEGNINDPQVAVKPTASMSLSDPAYEVDWDEPEGLKDVVKKCPDEPIEESISDYEEMENVDKSIEVENKGPSKSR